MLCERPLFPLPMQARGDKKTTAEFLLRCSCRHVERRGRSLLVPTGGTTRQLPLLLPLAPDARGLGPVVDEALFEPGVLESVLGRDALLGVVDEDFLEQVEELFVEGCVGWDDFL